LDRPHISHRLEQEVGMKDADDSQDQRMYAVTSPGSDLTITLISDEELFMLLPTFIQIDKRLLPYSKLDKWF
jgi:hypothetical protein